MHLSMVAPEGSFAQPAPGGAGGAHYTGPRAGDERASRRRTDHGASTAVFAFRPRALVTTLLW